MLPHAKWYRRKYNEAEEKLILLRSDKSDRTTCRSAREQFYWFYLAHKSKSPVSSRVGFSFPLFQFLRSDSRVYNSRFHVSLLQLLLNRLIYCRFRGVHGRQVQQGAVFPRWKMPDDRRRHRCLSLPARLHGWSLRNPGGPAGNRINSEGIISAPTYHRVYTRECGITWTLVEVSRNAPQYYLLRAAL